MDRIALGRRRGLDRPLLYHLHRDALMQDRHQVTAVFPNRIVSRQLAVAGIE